MNHHQPLFSIIVPGRDIENQIGRCLASIRAQSCTDYEVLMINDGSTDGTGAVVEKWKKKFASRLIILHQQNKGPGSARNEGIRRASGRYLIFIDGDDYVSPDLLERIREVIRQKPYDVVAYNGSQAFSSGFIEPMHYCGDFSGEVNPKEKKSCINVYAGVWNKAVRKEFYDNYGFSFPEGVWYEDAGISRLWLMKAQSVFFLQDRLYFYYQRAFSIMHSHVNRHMADVIAVCQNFRSEAKRLELYPQFRDEIDFSILVLVLLQVGGREINGRNPFSPLQDRLGNYIRGLYGGIPANPYVTPQVRARMECFLDRDYIRYHFRYQTAPTIRRGVQTITERLSDKRSTE